MDVTFCADWEDCKQTDCENHPQGRAISDWQSWANMEGTVYCPKAEQEADDGKM